MGGIRKIQRINPRTDARARRASQALSGTDDWVTGAIEVNTDGQLDVAAGGITTTKIADDAVTDAKLRESAAVSVIGRSANSTGNPADIAAAANDRVLARTSNTLAFQQLTVGMAPSNLWTYDKIQQVSAGSRLLGSSSSGAGNVAEITLGGTLAISTTTINVVNAGLAQRGAVLLAAARANSGQSTVTLGAVTDPADTPVDADALRDDLVANTLPSLASRDATLETAIETLAGEFNDLLTKLRSAGVLNT